MKLLWLAVPALMVACSTAAAGGDFRLTVDVPFDFYIGQQPMPAGTYDATRVLGEVVEFRHVTTGATGGVRVLRITYPTERATNSPDAPAVVFRRYKNGRSFLGEVWREPEVGGYRLPKSKLEREAVTSTIQHAATVTIYARR